MRKMTLAAVAAVTAIGAVGVAQAVTPTTAIKASVSPSKKGTKTKPANVKLSVELITPADCWRARFRHALDRRALRQEPRVQRQALKTCTASQVQADNTKCPTGSKVGSGKSATGIALGLTENLTVTAYNGPGGNKLELLVDG